MLAILSKCQCVKICLVPLFQVHAPFHMPVLPDIFMHFEHINDTKTMLVFLPLYHMHP